MVQTVYIEITNICNLSWPILPGTQRDPQFMTEETFTTILKQAQRQYETPVFSRHGRTAPPSPHWTVFDLACEKDFKVNLVTKRLPHSPSRTGNCS